MATDMQALGKMKAQIEKTAAETQDMQKALTALVQNMNTLQSQLTENKLVKEELDHIDGDSKIFKLVGPVLVPQDLDEARGTVTTRIDFISKELTTAKGKVETAERAQQEKRTSLLTAQQQFQTLVQQSAGSR